MTARMKVFVVALGLMSGLLGGCASPANSPASPGPATEFPIPDTVKTVGIIDFIDTSAVPFVWGKEVAGQLFTLLGKPAGPYNVWRAGAGDLAVGQRRPNGLPITSEQACRRARAVGAEAVVYGTTKVQIAITSSPDPESPQATRSEGRPGPIACRVTVRFVLDEVASGRTIASVLLTKAGTTPAGGPAAGRELATKLLRQCVKEFVTMINPK